MRKIYSITVRGNFYSRYKYQSSMDSISVLANSSEEAVEIAENNIDVITDMFRNKRITKRKVRMLRKSETIPVRIGRSAREENGSFYKEVLTGNNVFIEYTA